MVSSSSKLTARKATKADCYEAESEPNSTASSSSPTGPVEKNDKVYNKNKNVVAVQDEEVVPATWRQAISTFFCGATNPGPRLVLATWVGLAVWRLQLLVAVAKPLEQVPFAWQEGALMAGAIVFWWLQEHVLHKHLLHSSYTWFGQQIHQAHHARTYYHVSIDSPQLMLTFLLAVHVLLRCLLPLPWALSTTLGYAGAGLFYEWAHYIVHTQVPLTPNSYWYRMKQHHLRHHFVDSNYWFAFSVPAVDRFFGTNPILHQVVNEKKKQRKEKQQQQQEQLRVRQ